MGEAVQAARWNSFSGATAYSGCQRGDPANTCSDPQTSHYTCCDYCQYNVWGQCGYKYRTKAMVQLLFSGNAWNDVGSEGVWGKNSVYQSSSSHCGMVFNYQYNHQGIGYYPSGSTTMVGIKDTDTWEDHVFPHSTHFDWDQNDFTFLTQFFGGKKNEPVTADDVYLLYDGQMILMENVIGDGGSGFFRSIQSKTSECEPYAFIARDESGTWWRLPEDERYYFGTVDHPNALREETANCMENHYFYTGQEWVANGAEGLTNAKNTGNGCIGCDKVMVLEDVYNNRDSSVSTTSDPTTANPTTSDPTTAIPTTAIPTEGPTKEPTDDPTEEPTKDPTTANPTTSIPTTFSPTTPNPTTSNPTTAMPTTSEPTTANPTTAEPTISAPSTNEPTTANPTIRTNNI